MMLTFIKSGWSLLDKGFRRKIPFILFGFFILSILETLGIAAIFPVLIFVIEPESAQGNRITEFLSSFLPKSATGNLAAYLAVFIFIMFFVKNVAIIFVNRINFHIIQKYTKSFAVSSYGNYMRIPYLSSTKYDVSQLLYIINSSGSILYGVFGNNILIILSEFLTILAIFGLLIYANPVACGIAGGIIALSGLLIFLFTSRRLANTGHANRKSSEETTRLIRNGFGSFKELRVLGRASFFLKRFSTEWNTLARNMTNMQTYLVSTRYLIEIGLLVAIGIFVVVSIDSHTKGELVAQLGLFGLASLRILPSAARLFSSIQTLMTAKSTITLLQEERTRFEGFQLEPLEPHSRRTSALAQEPQHIAIQEIEFRYPSITDTSLSDINIDIPFGSSLGIVGASGAGKTTLADLILGVIQPSNGKILANNLDIHSDIYSWRERVAYVPQSITFIEGTLRDNIAFGVEPNEISDERIATVIELGQLQAVLEKLPDGLDTQVGEMGQFFSGGERQRIGIARAMYKPSSILVFDEATSALDVETEDRISNVIQNLVEHCSVIVIAHRLRTIMNCDQIAYLEQGKLIGKGSFTSLERSIPGFSRLVELSTLDSAESEGT